MKNETQVKDKSGLIAQTAWLSSPDPQEAEACLGQALLDQGVPEPAANLAASVYGRSFSRTKEVWGDTQTNGAESTATASVTPKDVNGRVFAALVKQATMREADSFGWTKLDAKMARKDAGILHRPLSVYNEAIRELIGMGKIALMVRGNVDPTLCFRTLAADEGGPLQ